MDRAEERAKELIPDVFGVPLTDEQKAFWSRIAQAIRQAENDVLELSCAAGSGAALRSIKFVTDHEPVAEAICGAIRSLKSKD